MIDSPNLGLLVYSTRQTYRFGIKYKLRPSEWSGATNNCKRYFGYQSLATMGTLKEFTNHDGSHKQQPYIGSCYNLLHVSHSYMMPAIDFFLALYKEWIITYASNQAIYICMLLGWSAQTGAGKPLALRSAETTAPGPAQPTRPGSTRTDTGTGRHTGRPWHASSSLRLSNYLAVGRCRSSWTNQCTASLQRNATERKGRPWRARPSRAGTGRRAHRPAGRIACHKS